MNCRKKVGLRHRSFRSFQARKTAFGAGKFWSVKKQNFYWVRSDKNPSHSWPFHLADGPEKSLDDDQSGKETATLSEHPRPRWGKVPQLPNEA
jgi:hypothetical protein